MGLSLMDEVDGCILSRNVTIGKKCRCEKIVLY